MTFAGDVTLNSTAVLNIELGGATPLDDFDQLLISGSLALGGTLNVSLIDGFNPAANLSFNILDWGSLSGTFNTIQLPAIAPGLEWDTSLLYTDGVLAIASTTIPGDFNQDGAVDAADYVVWRKTTAPRRVQRLAQPLRRPNRIRNRRGGSLVVSGRRSRAGNRGDADVCSGCPGFSTPGRIESPRNSSTSGIHQQCTDVTHVF